MAALLERCLATALLGVAVVFAPVVLHRLTKNRK
jgi:hypothetical protein